MKLAASGLKALLLVGLFLPVVACQQERGGPDYREVPRIEALDPQWDLSVAGDQQLDALMDGEVSKQEYAGGFDAFRSCLDVEGFQLNSVREIGGILEYGVSDEAVVSGAEEQCYLEHFAYIDATWQYENSEERAFIERVIRCLSLDREGGAVLATRVEAEKALDEAGRQVSDCP